MDLETCLRRIDYRGPREADLETLTELQRRFLYSVPFENLDIHLGQRITLSLNRFYEKIVQRGRGGFCYECNSLFHFILDEMGFEVSLHGAEMLLEDSWPLPLGHMVLLVNLDHTYLVDVGNGRSCREPLRIDGRNSAVNEGIEYRIHSEDNDYVLYYRDESRDWKPRFRFTTQPQKLTDFSEPCRIQQTSPKSRFTRHCLASIATAGGRITLLDNELTLQRDGRSEVTEITDAGAYGRALAEHFGIELPVEDIETLYKRIIIE